MTEVSKLRKNQQILIIRRRAKMICLFIFVTNGSGLLAFIASLGIMQLVNHPIGIVHSLNPFDDNTSAPDSIDPTTLRLL